MDNNNGTQLDANGLDMCDYMDVVTTYKCRFCSFTSSAPHGISEHVKNIHIQQPSQSKTETVQINDRKIPIDTALTVDMETGCVQIQSIPQSDLESNKVDVLSESTTLTNYNVLESLDELSTTGTEDKVQVSTSSSANENVSISVEAFNHQIERPTCTENNVENSTFNIITVPNISYNNQTTSDTQTIDNDDSQSSFILSDKGSSQPTQNQPSITKELFLCGQCSVGYSSIEDCKTHMVEDHGFQMEDPVDSNIKISVGTQVENTVKRPGRKKKSEVMAEQEEEKSQIERFSDSDWEADKDEYYIGSRSRRKIRRPKALTDGYFLPKGKRKVTYKDDGEVEDEGNTLMSSSQRVKRQRPEITEKYEEKCTVVGCYAKFKTKESLEIHTKCHIEKSHNFRCPSCSENFTNWRTVRFHMWKVHRIDTDLLECDTCHEFKTDTMSKLLVHKEIHSDSRPYTCHVCGKGFRQYSQMKNHEAIHSTDDSQSEPVKEKRQCYVCKRVFATQKCMMVHVEEVHGKNKPFKCSYCGYATSRKAMLVSHERTHTKEKPFKCEVCSFATGDHNSLRRHTMRHTGQRLYKCSCCPYTCIQAISIKMHMKNKHPNAPGIFCCNECTYRTVNEQFFKNHIEDHKNGLITEKEQNTNTRTNDNVHMTIQTYNENGIQIQDIIELHQNVDDLEKTRQTVEIQLMVQTLDSGETQISAEDFAKLSDCSALGSCNMSSGQLISFILNAIPQSSGANVGNSVVQIVNGIQISVVSSASKNGVSSHSVVIQVPVPNSDSVPITDSQVVLEPVNQFSDIAVQSLSFDDVDEGSGTQTNNQQVIMTPQGEINFVSNATIDDLAKISCIVKDGIVFDNSGANGESADINELNNTL